MNIRLAKIKDLNNINLLFKEVIDDVNNVKKINMFWGTVYPFCEFQNSIKNKEMYIIENKDKIIGSFTLSERDNPEYHAINWTSNNKKWFYLKRLAILPIEQGKGYAKIAMDYIHNYAINNNYEAIRLVVHENNEYGIGLYEKYGFIKVNGQLVFEDEIFLGYEKKCDKKL